MPTRSQFAIPVSTKKISVGKSVIDRKRQDKLSRAQVHCKITRVNKTLFASESSHYFFGRRLVTKLSYYIALRAVVATSDTAVENSFQVTVWITLESPCFSNGSCWLWIIVVFWWLLRKLSSLRDWFHSMSCRVSNRRFSNKTLLLKCCFFLKFSAFDAIWFAPQKLPHTPSHKVVPIFKRSQIAFMLLSTLRGVRLRFSKLMKHLELCFFAVVFILIGCSLPRRYSDETNWLRIHCAFFSWISRLY